MTHRSELLELRDLIAERLDVFDLEITRSELLASRGRWIGWDFDFRTRRGSRRAWHARFDADLVGDQHYVAVTKIDDTIRGLLR